MTLDDDRVRNRYHQALDRFSPADRDRIEVTMDRWTKAGRRIPTNLRREPYLPVELMAEVLALVLRHALPASTSDRSPVRILEAEVIELFRQRMKLRGGAATPEPMPVRLGRADFRRRFISRMFDDYAGLFGSASAIDEDLDRMADGKHPPPRWSACTMTRYLAWVTWDPDGGEPFEFLRGLGWGSRELVACLGLRVWSRRMLLFTYHNDPSRIVLCRATVADAENDWHFDHLEITDHSHGWTRCIGSDACPEPLTRPEAVHRPVHFNGLGVTLEAL